MKDFFSTLGAWFYYAFLAICFVGVIFVCTGGWWGMTVLILFLLAAACVFSR